MKTLGQLKNEAGRRAGKTDTTALERIAEGINRRYQETLVLLNGGVTERSFSATVETGQSAVGLPIEAHAVLSVYNATANLPVKAMRQSDMEARFGSLRGNAGGLRHYAVEGTRGAFKDVTSVGPLVLLAPSGEATTYRLTGFYGLVPGISNIEGTPFEHTVTLTGAGSTPVSTGLTPGSGAQILTFAKQDDLSATVNLYETLTSTYLSALAPKQGAASYTWLRFSTAADVDTTLRVVCRCKAPDLESDLDTPIYPGMEHFLVVAGMSELYRSLREFSKSEADRREYEKMRDDWIAAVEGGEEQSGQATGSGAEYRDEVDDFRIY